MRRQLVTLLAVSTIAAGLIAAPALHARDSEGSGNSMMGSGMMGYGKMGGMMSMMGQMSGMTEHCNEMMQAMGNHEGGQRPNEQWRNDQPEPQHQPQQQGRNG